MVDDYCTCDACAPVPLTCGTCRWMVGEECQRHAPAANTNPRDYRTRIFPVVQVTDLACGDYHAKDRT